MKKSELKQMIKEEYSKILSENVIYKEDIKDRSIIDVISSSKSLDKFIKQFNKNPEYYITGLEMHAKILLSAIDAYKKLKNSK